ncbi:4-hydroxy-tetrahydrodipicolinate synthase [Erysipelothrix larvae]|uniref:4-hydroxy-tetrahydrodipicolinate synthase n=1 Tax=Erysipelothrix larvae TaxID=1514105 RepID=A0A0X8H1E9_9FIRM|nr:4-hydroxy-tetrahydrodipicolinate synthase [Erysipelothrix larvae]AMC94344.1 4-hydroxy-tetrahydrodipicolinate synthase [Erysipelothrix larvae]
MVKVEGLIVALLTPFNEDESINYEATKRHIDDLIEKGIEGLFILGSNGEFHVLEHEEKIAFSQFVIEYTANRCPVYVGIGCNSTKETIKLAQAIEPFGPTAFSVITPYFMVPSQDELVHHYTFVANSTNTPIILYNIPKNTGINIEPTTLKILSENENIIGIKDSSGNMDNLKGYIDATSHREFSVLVGSDSKILDAYTMGACGAVCGTANVICEHDLNLIHAIKTNQLEEAQTLQKEIDVLRNVLKLGTTPSVMKRCVTLMGIDIGWARKPVKPTSPSDDEKIKEALTFYGLL